MDAINEKSSRLRSLASIATQEMTEPVVDAGHGANSEGVNWKSVEQFVANGEPVHEKDGLRDPQADSTVFSDGGSYLKEDQFQQLPANIETAANPNDSKKKQKKKKGGTDTDPDNRPDMTGGPDSGTFAAARGAIEENLSSATQTVQTVTEGRGNIQNALEAAKNQNQQYIDAMEKVSADFGSVHKTTKSLEDIALREVFAFEGHRGLAVQQASEIVGERLPGGPLGMDSPPPRLTKEQYAKAEEAKANGCIKGPKSTIENECKNKPDKKSTLKIDQARRKVLDKICAKKKMQTYIDKASDWCLDDKVPDSPFKHGLACTIECNEEGSEQVAMFIMALDETKEKITDSTCASDDQIGMMFKNSQECCSKTGVCDTPRCDTKMYVLFEDCVNKNTQKASNDLQQATDVNTFAEDTEGGLSKSVESSLLAQGAGAGNHNGTQSPIAAEIKAHREPKDLNVHAPLPVRTAWAEKAFLSGK